MRLKSTHKVTVYIETKIILELSFSIELIMIV